jgi:hypothetical protein
MVSAAFDGGFEDGQGGIHDFRSDIVARQNCDIELHE